MAKRVFVGVWSKSPQALITTISALYVSSGFSPDKTYIVADTELLSRTRDVFDKFCSFVKNLWSCDIEVVEVWERDINRFRNVIRGDLVNMLRSEGAEHYVFDITCGRKYMSVMLYLAAYNLYTLFNDAEKKPLIEVVYLHNLDPRIESRRDEVFAYPINVPATHIKLETLNAWGSKQQRCAGSGGTAGGGVQRRVCHGSLMTVVNALLPMASPTAYIEVSSPLYGSVASASLCSAGIAASVKAPVDDVEGVSKLEVCRRVAMMSGIHQVWDQIAKEIRELMAGRSSAYIILDTNAIRYRAVTNLFIRGVSKGVTYVVTPNVLMEIIKQVNLNAKGAVKLDVKEVAYNQPLLDLRSAIVAYADLEYWRGRGLIKVFNELPFVSIEDKKAVSSCTDADRSILVAAEKISSSVDLEKTSVVVLSFDKNVKLFAEAFAKVVKSASVPPQSSTYSCSNLPFETLRELVYTTAALYGKVVVTCGKARAHVYGVWTGKEEEDWLERVIRIKFPTLTQQAARILKVYDAIANSKIIEAIEAQL